MTRRPLPQKPTLDEIGKILHQAHRLATRVRRQNHETADEVLDMEAPLGWP